MSPGRRGSHGWSSSLTSFADVSFKGPGGGSGWRTWSLEIMRSRSSTWRPVSDPYAGKPVTTETKVRDEKPRKCMSFIVIYHYWRCSQSKNEGFILPFKSFIIRYLGLELSNSPQPVFCWGCTHRSTQQYEVLGPLFQRMPKRCLSYEGLAVSQLEFAYLRMVRKQHNPSIWM